MLKLFIKVSVCFGIILFVCTNAEAQHIANMPDKMQIELSLDLIRKGIQQEDTLKISSVFANQFATKVKLVNNKVDLNQALQSIFNNASQRELQFTTYRRPNAKSGLANSHFWDFDILSPKIEIKGDSASVDCELVLWGANSISSTEVGAKIRERFVFFAPLLIKPKKTDEDYHEWGSNKPRRLQKPKRAGWVLVRCDNFFEFLENYGEMPVVINNNGGGK